MPFGPWINLDWTPFFPKNLSLWSSSHVLYKDVNIARWAGVSYTAVLLHFFFTSAEIFCIISSDVIWCSWYSWNICWKWLLRWLFWVFWAWTTKVFCAFVCLCCVMNAVTAIRGTNRLTLNHMMGVNSGVNWCIAVLFFLQTKRLNYCKKKANCEATSLLLQSTHLPIWLSSFFSFSEA